MCGVVRVGGEGVEDAFGADELGFSSHAGCLRAEEMSRTRDGLESCR